MDSKRPSRELRLSYLCGRSYSQVCVLAEIRLLHNKSELDARKVLRRVQCGFHVTHGLHLCLAYRSVDFVLASTNSPWQEIRLIDDSVHDFRIHRPPQRHVPDSGTTPYCRNAVGECSHTNHPPAIIDQSRVYPESYSRPRLPLSQASSPPDPSSARINARSTRRWCCVDMIIKAARMQRLMRIEASDDKEKCTRNWGIVMSVIHALTILASCQYGHTDCWVHAKT